MNSASRSIRGKTAIVGIAAMGIFVADRMTRSKNNTVTMGINGQLDQMNTVADFGRDSS